MEATCYRCKGRKHCRRDACALKTKARSFQKHRDITHSLDVRGKTPSVFVGHHGYPQVNVGLLTTPVMDGEEWKRDAPRHWAARNLDIPSIVDCRSSLIHSRFTLGARQRDRLLSLSQEIAMASTPPEVEMELKQKPSFRLDADPYTAPMGPSAAMVKVSLISHPKIHRKIDQAVSDTDLKATDALSTLYRDGFDEHVLTRLLSIGNLGVSRHRKLVPTRWSITAVDDTISKALYKNVRDYQETDLLAYFGGYLGNYYLIMMFPGAWGYELFEIYLPGTDHNSSDEYGIMTDHEGYHSRKDYAENCAGGYYAARLAILESLHGRKRQGTIIAIRMITGEYSVPLGVWVCREAARKSLSMPPISFGSKELMLTYGKAVLHKKFGYDASTILKGSVALKELQEQSRLSVYE